jgi:hypothetical protein
VRFQLAKRELQLDELVAAIGSPIGAAAKDQQQTVSTHQGVQLSILAVLIRQRKVGYRLPNLGTRVRRVVLSLHEVTPIIGGYILPACGEFAYHLVENCALALLIHRLTPLMQIIFGHGSVLEQP